MIRAALLVLLFLPTFSLAQETRRDESAQRAGRVTRQDLAALVQVLDARLAGPLIDGSLQGDALRAANERFDRISIQFLGGRPERVATELEGWLEELEPAGAWRARRRRERFPERTLRLWLAQLLSALAYLHSERVIHRDVKTGNVFLTSGGDVMLGDLSLIHI